MSYAARIIEKFGGTRAMANAMGLAPSTVQSWKNTGLIPAKHQQAILEKAQSLELQIAPADFFDSPATGGQSEPARSAA